METEWNDVVAVGVAAGVDRLYTGVIIALRDSETGDGATAVLSAETARALAADLIRASLELDDLRGPQIERVAVSSQREYVEQAIASLELEATE